MAIQRSEIITLGFIIAIIVAVGVFAFVNSKSQSRLENDVFKALGNSDGESSFTDLDGNPLTFEHYEGKTLVVNSWATWCPFCTNELPDFSKLAKEFENEEVVIIAINRKEPDAKAKAFIKHLQSSNGIVFIQDPDDAFYKSIGGFSMPETVFYDKRGNISFHKRGFMTLDEMKEHTTTALTATNHK